MATIPICITDLTGDQIRELAAELSEPVYRAAQLQSWIYRRLPLFIDDMPDLPQSFRQRLAMKVRLHSLVPAHEMIGDDGTVKVLFTLADGKTIESALMPYPAGRYRSRYTVCVSTQVGCPVGCPFCATGQQGFERNLTPGEIIDQVLYFARWLRDHSNQAGSASGQLASHITNLVFMGMGEPLANYNALWQAMEMLNSPDGFDLGARHMVISTAGLVPQIERLSREQLQVGLAVSLHASSNTLRNTLVPINKKYPLDEIMPACRRYCQATGRRISFEYILFDNLNDSTEDARSLARLVAGLNCHVNLIAANPTTNGSFRPPHRSIILTFEQELRRLRIACTLRQGKGLDIDSGCGQLRSRFLQPTAGQSSHGSLHHSTGRV
ncbi:MAG: 23S rRNA (adenine(2503)-C(2))-methyltransferase RlmN [Chloroflexi bacterium]|nr:23S rRNA (adenine(2503)-C(2))-methyltransferase RlmN [Chloroflexota bacterium]